MRLPRPALLGAALLALSLAAGSTPRAPPVPSPGPSSATSGRPATGARTVEGWPVATPSELGPAQAAVERGAAEARRLDSTCFAVVRNGKLAGEWNWSSCAATSPREVFSITKSVTSTLVGIAVRDGDLRLDDRVSTYVPQWRGTAVGVGDGAQPALQRQRPLLVAADRTTPTCSPRGAARSTPSGCRSSTPPAAPGPTTTPRSRCSSRCWRRRPGCASRGSPGSGCSSRSA